MLMGPDNEHPCYNFPRVMTLSGNTEGVDSVLDLCKLYNPINKTHNYWLLLRARLEDKTIELWDSCGYSKTNKVYMQFTCRYLYDVHQRENPQDQNTLDNWRLAWRFNDQSAHSPRQENPTD